jgi:NAD(P)H-quinone oxidoreductase subunit 4
VRLAPVAPRETIPAIALVAAVVVLGLLPSSLSRLSEVATTSMATASQLSSGLASGLASALSAGGVG